MTQTEIIEMARKAGYNVYNNCADGIVPDLERFAKLVAEREREACAKECDVIGEMVTRGKYCANVIRARGKK